MADLIERGGIPDGYKAEVFDGRVIMTPQSPEQDWTVGDIKAAARAAGIVRERMVSDVLVTFPGENDAAPDLTIVDFGAERRKNSFSCVDALAVAEVVSEPDDEKDYVRNVRKYGRYGIDCYLLADPFKGVCLVMTEPAATGYGRTVEVPYGEPVVLTLRTGERVTIDTGTFPTRQA